MVMERHQGEDAVAILATETKKRVWYDALVGTVGPHMPIRVHDPGLGILQNLFVDCAKLQQAIDLVHSIRKAGFQAVKNRRAYPILEGLFSEYRTAERVGFAQTREFEKELKPWRGTPELTCAVLIEGYSMKPAKGGEALDDEEVDDEL